MQWASVVDTGIIGVTAERLLNQWSTEVVAEPDVPSGRRDHVQSHILRLPEKSEVDGFRRDAYNSTGVLVDRDSRTGTIGDNTTCVACHEVLFFHPANSEPRRNAPQGGYTHIHIRIWGRGQDVERLAESLRGLGDKSVNIRAPHPWYDPSAEPYGTERSTDPVTRIRTASSAHIPPSHCTDIRQRFAEKGELCVIVAYVMSEEFERAGVITEFGDNFDVLSTTFEIYNFWREQPENRQFLQQQLFSDTILSDATRKMLGANFGPRGTT
ncbi:hypothetical protein C8R45DRAFT_946050 [Mycena sanguinolenta]|nr:hypothetical protein C8R45DRAFT_946050 [Mycena sanguinolenta]